MRRRPARCWRNRGVGGGDGAGEITVARSLLARLPLRGRIVTGDALHCQRETCQLILDAGGDYFFQVEANQPTLYEDITTPLEGPPPRRRFAGAQQGGRHGDRHELRRLWASTALTGYLDWPGTQQVGKVVRRVRPRGVVTTQTRYFITSVAAAV